MIHEFKVYNALGGQLAAVHLCAFYWLPSARAPISRHLSDWLPSALLGLLKDLKFQSYIGYFIYY